MNLHLDVINDIQLEATQALMELMSDFKRA